MSGPGAGDGWWHKPDDGDPPVIPPGGRPYLGAPVHGPGADADTTDLSVPVLDEAEPVPLDSRFANDDGPPLGGPPWGEPELPQRVPLELLPLTPPEPARRPWWREQWRRLWRPQHAADPLGGTIRWHALVLHDVTRRRGITAAELAAFLEAVRAEAGCQDVPMEAITLRVATWPRRDGRLRHVWAPICRRADTATWWDE